MPLRSEFRFKWIIYCLIVQNRVWLVFLDTFFPTQELPLWYDLNNIYLRLILTFSLFCTIYYDENRICILSLRLQLLIPHLHITCDITRSYRRSVKCPCHSTTVRGLYMILWHSGKTSYRNYKMFQIFASEFRTLGIYADEYKHAEMNLLLR